MNILKPLNLALRFLLELCLLAALGSWGYSLGGSPIVKVFLALLVVLIVSAIWGIFLSPKRQVLLPGAARLLLEVALFALAVVALAATGHPTLAAALAIVYAINRTLISLWQQA